MKAKQSYLLSRAYLQQHTGGESGNDLSNYYTKAEVNADVDLLSQGIINVATSVSAINDDITGIDSELDEIDTQVIDINEELDDVQEI